MLQFAENITPEERGAFQREYGRALEVIGSLYGEDNLIQGYSLHLSWNSRLRVRAGDIKRTPWEFEIRLNPRYRQFGLERCMKTFRHELAHMIQYILRKKFSHDKEFKRICAELGGSMSSRTAGKKYSHLVDDYIVAPHKYLYRCPCGAEIRTKKKLPKSNYCKQCGTKILNFELVSLAHEKEKNRQMECRCLT